MEGRTLCGVRFGIDLPILGAGSSFGHIKAIAISAEKFGYSSIWVMDHLLCFHPVGAGSDDIHECLTTISSLAALTNNILLGTAVVCIPFRPPTLLAKMTTTIDHVSKGRFILGIGAGWYEKEFHAYGIRWEDIKRRFERTREAVKIIKDLWTKKKVNFHGKYYSIFDGALSPKPLQKPHPPIWFGGVSRQALDIVANYCDGWLPVFITAETYRKHLRRLKTRLESKGRKLDEITKSLIIYTCIAENHDEVVKKYKMQGEKRFGQTFERMKDKMIAGDPDECVESIEKYVAAGVQHFVLFFTPFNTTLDDLEFFSKNVISRD